MASCGTFQKLSPLSLLSHLSSCYDSAHFKVDSGQISWSIYIEEGEIIYASHSVATFERLDYHLQRLSHKIPKITTEVRTQLSLIFEHDLEKHLNSEYQAIGWLVNHQYLNFHQAVELIEELIAEVLESFLLIRSGTYQFEKNNLDRGFDVSGFPLQPIIDKCQKRLQAWEALGPLIWSPYQRLYFSKFHNIDQQLLLGQQKFSSLLKGFSFRHLAAILNQDELKLAQSLHQHILAGTILLQDPYPPFDQLPRSSPSISDQGPQTNSVTKLPLPIINNSNARTVIPPVRAFSINQSRQIPSLKVEKINPDSVRQTPQVPPQKVETNSTQVQPESIQFRQTPPPPQKVESNSPPHSEVIPRAAKQTTDRADHPPAAVPTAKSTYKVVCVDDSPAILQELNRCLEDEIFSVFTINNPIKALMQIIRIKPDLVLLDVNMAGIDGYELCRLLRNHTLFKNTPIIMVTGNTGIINRVKARMVGASGYITKPFTQSDLLKMVFKHLS